MCAVHALVWYGVAWHGMVRYGMVWHGVVYVYVCMEHIYYYINIIQICIFVYEYV